MAVVLWLISVVVTLYVLYHVIRSAFDNSETNRLLRDIRDQLVAIRSAVDSSEANRMPTNRLLREIRDQHHQQNEH